MGLIVDEDGAEQRLLCLDIVRCLGRKLRRRWLAQRGDGRSIGWRHGVISRRTAHQTVAVRPLALRRRSAVFSIDPLNSNSLKRGLTANTDTSRAAAVSSVVAGPLA